MHRYPIKAAAQLAQASYKGQAHRSLAPRIANSLDENDVQAHFLDNRILVIPGSNSVMDYLKFNLRILNIGGKKYRIDDPSTAAGHSGTRWHQGFLAHAKTIWDWMEAENQRPIYIIGHSLGAAATQILCKSYRVPGIGFACPRPRKSRGGMHQNDLCLCINRNDDRVCDLPGTFHHLGHVATCIARRSGFGMEHSMKFYRKSVEQAQATGQLPVNWPR
ncbi:MAG: hypothetical protein AB3N23_02180 [Paracoccaceae bacterium]